MNARAIVATLKDINAVALQLDELMVLAAQAQSLRNQYEQREVEVPTWLTDANMTLNAEIQSRNRDNLMQRLRTLEQQEQALMTPTEKRASIATQKAALQKQLGLTVEEPVSSR